MFSPIFFTTFFPQFFLSLSSWKRKQICYWSKIVFFSQIASWKRNDNKYAFKELVDSEFDIGETIWWICYRLEHELTNSPKSEQKFTKTNIRDCCSDDVHILYTDFFLSIKVIICISKDNFEQCQLFSVWINCIFVTISTTSIKKIYFLSEIKQLNIS